MSVCYSCRYRYIYNPKSEWGPVLATFRFVFFVCVYAISSWALLYIALMGKTAIRVIDEVFRKYSTIYCSIVVP